jgi:predicted nucleotidyltransferase
MMGGSGGGRYSGPSSTTLQQRLEKIRDEERARLDKNIGDYLRKLLVRFNDRDREKIAERLDAIHKLLGQDVEINQLLLGGSVAKHTAVDGLSDVDALVVLDREDLRGKSAQAMLNAFHQTLEDKLPRTDVLSVQKGRLAVTVVYRDKTEIQLLPALRSGQTVSIAAADGKSWNDTRPRVFGQQLTQANQRLGQSLVPAIKLAKALVGSLPEQKQLTGYHIEAMAVDAAKGYRGNKTPKALLLHILRHASTRVLTPIKDATGQSRTVDTYLGKAESVPRRVASQALSGLARRLDAASSLGQWKSVFGEP